MEQLIEYSIIITAIWRITFAINSEKIGQPIRKLFGERESDTVPGMFTTPDKFMSNMINCFRCLSFWISILCIIIYIVFPPILYPFSLSTLSILFNERLFHG